MSTAPVVDKHAQQAIQIDPRVEFGQRLNVFRVGCACGWAGCWYGSPQLAYSSHARHAVRMAEAGQ